MSETRWTPGHWVLEDRRKSRRRLSAPDGSWYEFASIVVRMKGDDADKPEGVANAHLIAAAPTLYETAADVAPALRRVAAEMNLGPDDEGRDWYEMLIACADDLDLAMAKARGEQ